MFTGLVEERAKIAGIESRADGVSLLVRSELNHGDTELGDSICIDGVCLSVVSKDGRLLRFDLSEETLRRTSLGRRRTGDAVNLERSLRVGSKLGGHFVFGHVDGVGTLLSRASEKGSERFTFGFPDQLRPFFAPKGSVSVSGVSLTVGEVHRDHFSVYLIPITLQKTTLGTRSVGDEVNLEVDMLARYVVSLRHAELNGWISDGGDSEPVTVEWLRRVGFV